MYKLNANQEVLTIMIRDYLNAEKKSYIEKYTGKQIPFNMEEITAIAKILSEQTNGLGILIEDIDKAVDEHLMRSNYAYEHSSGLNLSNQYVAKTEENYYYYSLIELDIYGGARNVSEAMYLISQEARRNLKFIKRNPKLLEGNKIKLNIVKNNSTKYLKDSSSIIVMHGTYDITTGGIQLNFKDEDMAHIYPNK